MLNFALQLDERLPDRVFVSVLLSPEGEEVAEVDGVAAILLGPQGEPVSSRLMLPIAGALRNPLLTTVELRATGPIPPGTRVHATAWHEGQQWEVSIPADPGTQLEAHCRGLSTVRKQADPALELRGLESTELEALQGVFPWLVPTPQPPLKVMETDEVDLKQACSDLGLDPEDVSWLEDLLSEP